MDAHQESNVKAGSKTPAVVEAESTIVDKVEEFVRRFVYFKYDSLYRLVALWIIATHLHQEFEYMGYLFAHSAGITSERRLLEGVRMHLAYCWFVRLGLEQVLNDGDGVRRFRSH